MRHLLATISGVIAAILVVFACHHSYASDNAELWPGSKYDSSIPTMREVLGYDPGTEIHSFAEILKYVDALSEAAPDRVRVFTYGTTWEGRNLTYIAIGSPKVIENLDEYSNVMERLSDPRITNQQNALKLIENLPAPVWLAYGVHGNEISSCEAALFTAYHLLAAMDDSVVKEILDNTVVFIDPSQNPDGRDRFVNHFRQERGRFPDEHRLAAEHNEPWPGGRTNHYYFDLNRDWFSMTQPETRGKVAALRKRRPIVVIDLHEMGGDSTYYFAPPAEPHNPHLVKSQHEHLQIIGQTNAHWFDEFGFDYFTRDTYDWFYPGYGDSWPAFYGAAASTYEQASTRGLLWRQRDGDLLTYRDAVRQHFVASISTLSAVAKNRVKFLGDYYEFQATAVESGRKGPIRAYGLPLKGDVSLVHKLAGLLGAQGVEVSRVNNAFEAQGEYFAEGSYLISLEQPMGRFVRTMFDENTPMQDEFLEEQERRRAKRLRHEMYDVTAWSFPHLFNVTAIGLKKLPGVSASSVVENTLVAGTVVGDENPVAYLVPWGTMAATRFLADALREGIDVTSVDKPFEQKGRTYPGGTLIIKTQGGPDDLGSIVQRLAHESGAEVVSSDTTWVDSGVDFGSKYAKKVRLPRIALAWDRPTSSYSAGAARYVIEREIGLSVTPVRVAQLASVDIYAFDVLVLPDGQYTETSVSKAVCDRIVAWTKDGGTLIALGRATQFLANERVNLLKTKVETLATPSDDEESKKKDNKEKDKEKEKAHPSIIKDSEAYIEATRPDEVKPDVVPGAMLNVRVDQDHWLGAGLSETLSVLYTGNQIVSPLKLDKGVNVAYFDQPDSILKSGYLWKENRAQLAFKPFIMVQPSGRGLTIAFTSDPLTRGYQNGLFVPFASAVMRGPAHADRP